MALDRREMIRGAGVAALLPALAVSAKASPLPSGMFDLSDYPGRLESHQFYRWKGREFVFHKAAFTVKGADVSMRAEWVEPMTGLYEQHRGESPHIEIKTEENPEWHDPEPDESLREIRKPDGEGGWKMGGCLDSRLAREIVAADPADIFVGMPLDLVRRIP